jgi:hypothetical protein
MPTRRRPALLGLALLLGIPCASRPADASEYRVVEVENGGTIQGHVKLDRAIRIPRYAVGEFHAKQYGSDELESDRIRYDSVTLGLADCVLSIQGIAAGKDWPEAMRDPRRKHTVAVVSGRYEPHVSWLRPRTQLSLTNRDACEHNVHGYRNTLLQNQFNLMLAVGGTVDSSDEAFLEKPGLYLLRDDTHRWMTGSILAFDHPYVAGPTGRDGRYEITSVPPGTWEIACWHEGLLHTVVTGPQGIVGYDYGVDVVLTQTVTVEPGKTATLDFTVIAP